jgi:inward rectifier potassium channel
MREVFYFSCQTFTTVGYGDLHPVSDFANIVASIEAMNGWLTFALFTGLIYGRFARPRPHLRFSEKAVVAPYRGITGLMFRFVSTKESHTLTNVQVTVSLGLQVNENGSPVYRFYDLPLERNHVDSLPMNFTVVHPIDEQSPLWGYSAADLQEADVELFVLVQAFDDVYNATVQQRTSYTFDEIRVGEKFVPMFRESNDKNTTILEVQKLSVVVSAPVTQPVA